MDHLTLVGRVEQIRAGIARVTVFSNAEIVAYADIEENKLTENGIADQDRFEMEIYADKIIFKKIPRRKLSADEIAEIREKLDRILPDSILKDV